MALDFPIALAKTSYDPGSLADAMAAIAPLLPLKRSWTGQIVLLKPNLITGLGSALACTSASVVVAVARWFLDHGARVRIGDSPAFGTAGGVMDRWGMRSALAGLPVDIDDFSQKTTMVLADGLRLGLATAALECDLFVNLPKLKAHDQMLVTGAVKNLYGVVVGSRKAMLHMTHGGSHSQFADLLIQLPGLLPAQVSLVDAVEVMHRSGPVSGERLELGCIAGGRDPVALDTALLGLLHLPLERSPLWQAAARLRHPGCSLPHLRFPLAQPEDFAGSAFVAPESLDNVRFNPFRFVASMVKRWHRARPA